MYKKALSFLILSSICMGMFFSAHANTTVKQESCNDVAGYELYKCRVKNICDNPYKPKKIIFNTQETDEQKYLELEEGDENFLEDNKKKYRENMNNLYACALIQAQVNALKNMNDKIPKDTKVADKTDTRINDRIGNLEKR